MTLSIQSLSKAYGAHDLFQDFSLEVHPGTRLAVAGPNGAGKSTFLRMLAGDEPLDAGRVQTLKGARMGYSAQDLTSAELDRTVLGWVMDVLPSWGEFWREWEAAVTGGDQTRITQLSLRHAELEQSLGYNPEYKAHAVLSGLGFAESEHSRFLRELSGGWRERAKLARVLVAGSDVLLLDEPTNHLDLEAVEWLESFLLGFEGVLVFVAHDRVFLDRVGTHVLYLGGSRPMVRKGSFSDFLVWSEEMEGQREREARRLADEVERKMDFVRRFKAKATKARQAGSRKKQALRLEKELEGLRPEPKRKTLNFAWPEPNRSDKTVLSVVDLEFSFPGGKKLWPKLGFSLYRGQKVALAGPNGCGKSTLLKLVMGRLAPDAGRVVLGQAVTVAYYSQHQVDILDPEALVLSQIRGLSDPRMTEEELMSVLGLFMLGSEYFERRVEDLSGGERARLILATLFLKRANFLVLDEPTNHLDLESREALMQALERYEGTVLFVAHDRMLLSRVAEQIWALGPQGVAVHLDGFAGYDRARKEAAQSGPDQAGRKVAEAAKVENREDLKRRKREQAELRNRIYRELRPKQEAFSKQEKELESVLARMAEVEAALADPAVLENSSRMTVLLKEYEECRGRSETCLEQLDELEQEIKALEARREAD